ncbi:sensor histidine kinase [Cellulosilyticum sp. I15G10I2]|uniref:sensor histidine kinase n=1 Tax=Cellulosilyticum sp. I15G10I2 TaxID=1892843 RepID=UPI001A9A5A52|nr:hypothetical protein [Cellulosilyticum sp. I15G10I2]
MKEVKKDIGILGAFVIGVILLMYLVMGQLDFSFFKYTMNIFIAIMSIGATMLMKNSVGKSTNNTFKFLAIIYRYIAISIIILMMIRNHYGLEVDQLYINFRLGLDIFEISCLLAAYRYLDKEFNQTKVYFVRLLFFAMMIYTSIFSKLLDSSMEQLQLQIYFIEGMVIGLILWACHLNYHLVGKFDKKIIWRMYLFLGFKCSYHVVSIFYMNVTFPIDYFIIILLRFIYTYYLVAAIFYERVLFPWHELVQSIQVTKDQLDDNERDRNSIINLSHELKTPINVIQSAADILNLDFSKANDEALIKGVQHIKKVCYQATRLITQIIDNNKLAEGHLQPKYSAYNLVTVAENTAMALLRYNPEWHILFDTEEEEVKVYIDEELIQRTILNIIVLLMHYQKKEPTIYIDIKMTSNQAEISIRSPYTELPKYYCSDEENYYSSHNINEMASFEFINKVLKLHQAKLRLLYNQENETVVYIQLEHKPFLEESQIQVIDYEENIDMLLGRIKVQYADF